MKVYKRLPGFLVSILSILMVLVTITQPRAQEVVSDYQIQKDFKKEYKSLNSKIDAARELAEIQKLIEQIKEFEETYADHEMLLDKVLYPDTFDEELTTLKERAVTSQQRLATIQKQGDKLEELTDKLANYDSRLEQLNKQTDSLRVAISKSTSSEKQLSGLVRRYRNNLEERDELIMSIVDSVLISYRNLDIKSMENFEKSAKQARLSSDGNVLKMVQSIAEQNVEFLNTNPTVTTRDYLRMNAVQNKFELMWETVGNKLVEVYGGNDKEQARTNVEQAINAWNEKITTQTWASISASFTEAGIELPEFSDQESFFNALAGYLDQAIENSQNGGANYQDYEAFSDFWTTSVQMNWTPHLQEGEVLTNQQIASIDQKLNQWAKVAEPESNMIVYLLGFSVLAIVVLGAMLFREKSTAKKS